MEISKEGLALTKRFEGLRLSAYRDGAGILTIGYGHTGPDVHEGMQITEEEAEALLVQDMQVAVACVNHHVTVALRQCQFDALADFVYNAGSGNFRSSTLLAKLNRGDYSGAAEEFGLWIHAGGKVEQGLVHRRKAEAEMFMGVGN